MNAMLSEYGLKQYSFEEIEKLTERNKNNLYCPSLSTHADWNSDGTFSLIDIVLMQQYYNSSGVIEPTYSGNIPYNVIDFGYLSGIYSGVNHWRFDLEDKNVAMIAYLNCPL